jgi:lysophospholipase L1-like esterase
MKIYLTFLAIVCVKLLAAQASNDTWNQYNIAPGDRWYDTYQFGSQELSQAPYSIFKFSTSAADIKVTGWSNLHGIDPTNSRLQIKVDGIRQSPLQLTNGPRSYDIFLGGEGINKVVEITVGLQTQPFARDLTGIYGTALYGVSYPEKASFSVLKPEAPEILILGTSIMSGYSAKFPDTDGVLALLRNTYKLKAALHGWSAATLHQETATQEKRQQLIHRIVQLFKGNSRPRVWIERQTNDYGLDEGVQSAANYKQNTAAFIDELKDSLPQVRIYLQTALVRTYGASVNRFGNLLSDYRSICYDIASPRSNFVSLINGLEMVSVSNLNDGLHPNEEGMAEYAQKIMGVLNSSNTTLPVRFSHFSTVCSNGIVLNWKTAQEANSDRFFIERSDDGRSWKAVGSVVAAGNSLNENSYTFTDKNSTGFYRIVEVARDGSKILSSVIKSTCSLSSALKISPNVVSKTAVVSITSSKPQHLSLNLYNHSGSIVKHLETDLAEGNTNVLLDMGSLSNGMYTLRAAAKGEMRVAKIIKID